MTNFDAKAYLAEHDSLGMILDISLTKELRRQMLEGVLLAAYCQGRVDSLKDAQEDRG